MEKKIAKCKHEGEYSVVDWETKEGIRLTYYELGPAAKKIVDEQALEFFGKDCTCEIVN